MRVVVVNPVPFGAAFADAVLEVFRFLDHPKGRNAVEHAEGVDAGF